MKLKSIIGITPSVNDGVIRIRGNYAEAIIDAGGIPAFLPYTEDKQRMLEYCDSLDGLLFSGGVDIDPKHYGEEKRFDSVEIDEARDRFELSLFKEYYSTGKPIFGICRGIQLINVALGGTLCQHIDGHKQSDDISVFNRTARIKRETMLYDIVRSDVILTNSFHHQAVKTVPDAVAISANATDGTVEAIELSDHKFLLAVQWHPELFYKNDLAASKLFEAFVSSTKQ